MTNADDAQTLSRDADADAETPEGVYAKTYVVTTEAYGDGTEFDHASNQADVVNVMGQVGLRLRNNTAVNFIGASPRADGESVDLTYQAQARPKI